MLNGTRARALFRSVPRLLFNRHASRESIAKFQDRRLRAVVRHAYEHVPYYRRLFDEAGIKPGDIRSRADLQLIPITTKETLRALSIDEIVADTADKPRLQRFETNGSTGVPLVVYRSKGESATWLALVWRARAELGIGRGHRMASINWGTPHRSADTPNARRPLLFRIAGLETWDRIDCREPLSVIVERLKEARPDGITGYAGVLSRVADVLGTDQTDLRPRFVLSASEVLTPAMRSRIEQVFHAPVRDIYASWEFNLMAYECAVGKVYHVCDDNLIMEVRKDGREAGPGESGEVVGTSLQFGAMPLIRYQIGDVVTRGPERCVCGSPFTTLTAIQGRMVDYFRLPDGRVMHPYEMGKILWQTAFRCMKQYQIIQTTPSEVVLRIVLRPEYTESDISEVLEKVRALLGPLVTLKIEYLDEIQPGVKGKFGVYSSLVSSEYTPTS